MTPLRFAVLFAVLCFLFGPERAYATGLPMAAAAAAGSAATPSGNEPAAANTPVPDKKKDPTADAQKALDMMGQHALLIATLLIGIGTFAMAIVEVVKSLLLVRMRYHRWSVFQWTGGRERNLGKLLSSGSTKKHEAPEILAELELLAAGGHDSADALYDQPVEKLMGQIQAAANVALDFPDVYPALYGFLTSAKASEGVAPLAASDSEHWRSNHGKVAQARALAARMPGVQELAPAAANDAKNAAAARTRLSNQVSRKLDAFQLQTQYFWTRLNQWASVPLGAVLFYVVYPDQLGGPLATVLLSISAGVLAPFAKDLKTNLASFAK